MKFTTLVFMFVLIPVLIVGCAGTNAQLLAFDTIAAAADQAKIGVSDYDKSALESSLRAKEAWGQAMQASVKNLALEAGMSDEDAKGEAAAFMAQLNKALANFQKEEERRAKLFNITMNNLSLIISIAEQAKEFELYRSSVGAQMKAYIKAVSSMKGNGNE